MPDSDARIDLARRIFLICNPPDTLQELFDNGTTADRTRYFRLADLALDVAAGAVREYRTHQAALEAALGDQTDTLEFPLAYCAPVLVEAAGGLAQRLTTVTTPRGREQFAGVLIRTPEGPQEIMVSAETLRPR